MKDRGAHMSRMTAKAREQRERRKEDQMVNPTPRPTIQVVGDSIWFEGRLMATIDAPEGTLRSQFVELIDGRQYTFKDLDQ